MGLLDGKVAVVTGGSRGIGREIALRFASEGASVAFTATSLSDKALETLSMVRALGVKAEAYACNACDFEATHAVMQAIQAEFGRIDILVNNAGVTRDTLVLRMSEQQWDDVLDTNLKGAFNACHAVVPMMMKQRSGSIVNMSSIVGVGGNAGQSNYAASKAGLIGFSKSLAKEMGSRGIRVNCLAPGFIETDMTGSVPEEVRKQWAQNIPLRRAGSPEDVAQAALFLASEMSSYITGQVIGITGGMD